MNEKRYVLHKDDQRKQTIRSNAMNYILTSLPENKSMEIVIRQHKKTHNDEQRKGFHYLCQTLGDRLGYSLGEIKELVKKEVYGTHPITIGSRTVEVTQSSEVNEEGELRDTLDYSRLLDGVYLLAAEAGEVLPQLDPDHYWKKRKAG